MPNEGQQLLEIRTYRIKPGQRDAFHALVKNETIPLVIEHGMRVIRFGPSMHDVDSYVLMRVFANFEERERLETSFYGSELWLERYEDRIMAMIDDYITVVTPVPSASVDALTRK